MQVASIDVVGAQLVSLSPHQDPNPSTIQLWYMPLTKASHSTDRPVRTLRKTPPITLPTTDHATTVCATIHAAITPKRILSIINPASGRKQALKVYNRRVLPILEAAGATVVAHVTQSKGHATKIVASTPPTDTDLILSLGGDGTTFEILQGVLHRPDWEVMRAVPIVQVPCGSGNALAASTNLWDVPTAVHAALRGRQAPLDVASVVQCPGGRFFSFLSVTYGMISTMDVGTEHLRWLGGMRFIVGAIQQVIQQNTYGVKVAYLEEDGSDDDGIDIGLPPTQHKENGTVTCTDEEEQAVDNDNNDSASTWLTLSSSLGFGPRLRHLKQFLPVAHARDSPPPPIQSTSTATTTTPVAAAPCEEKQEEEEVRLPTSWHWMPAQEVQLFAACNLPRLDMNFLFAPEAAPHSGHWNLIYTAGKLGRKKGMEVLTASEHGRHMHLVEQRRLRAVWVEPNARAGSTWLVVDGEAMPHRPMYAEIHPGLCRVLVAPPSG